MNFHKIQLSPISYLKTNRLAIIKKREKRERIGFRGEEIRVRVCDLIVLNLPLGKI